MIEIRTADDPEALEAARRLIREHFAAHSTAHDQESSEAIISALPQPYVPPRGGLWVAFVDGIGSGCAALREIDSETGEVKRMYVDPEMRGKGIARTLALHVIDQARAIGYTTLRLGTLRSMRPAQESTKILASNRFHRIARSNSVTPFSTSSTYATRLRARLVSASTISWRIKSMPALPKFGNGDADVSDSSNPVCHSPPLS